MGGEDLVERAGEALPRHAGGIAGQAPAGVKRTSEGENGLPCQQREKADLATGGVDPRGALHRGPGVDTASDDSRTVDRRCRQFRLQSSGRGAVPGEDHDPLGRVFGQRNIKHRGQDVLGRPGVAARHARLRQGDESVLSTAWQLAFIVEPPRTTYPRRRQGGARRLRPADQFRVFPAALGQYKGRIEAIGRRSRARDRQRHGAEARRGGAAIGRGAQQALVQQCEGDFRGGRRAALDPEIGQQHGDLLRHEPEPADAKPDAGRGRSGSQDFHLLENARWRGVAAGSHRSRSRRCRGHIAISAIP